MSAGDAKAAAPNPPTLAIGAKAPDFSLPGIDGKTYGLKNFADAKVLVVVFNCNHCPTAQAYEARIAKLCEDYKAKGVAVVAISPNDPLAVRLDELGFTDLDDSFEHMKIRAKDHKYPYPYLYDGENQAISKAFGVLATPHVYIFDESRTLRYNGRFDDSEVKTVKSHDAVNAVEALLAGKPVPVEKTRVVGCSTKWSDKRSDVGKSLAKWNAEPVSIEPIDESALAKLMKNDGKKLRLVNVWATWCGPCVAEMEDLTTMHRMYRGRPFEMITISTDAPEKKDAALDVLTKHHLSAKNYIRTTSNEDKFAESLDKEWPGPVPYTLLVAPGGKVIYRKVGAFDALELKRAIVGYTGRTY